MLLTGTIDRIEEDNAVIILSDQKQIICPLSSLPPEVNTGSILTINIEINESLTAQKSKLAKNFLNDILGG